MKVYIASSFARQAEMREIAARLEVYGVTITSRWLHEEQTAGTHKYLMNCAFTDLNDIRASDLFVRFSDDLSGALVPSTLATGARMVEMGVALERGIPIIVVGGRQQVFDFLPHITHIKDEAALIRLLSVEEIN